MWYQTRGNKYHAKTSVYNGYAYASQKEAAYAAELDLRKRAKDIKDWERQVVINLEWHGFHVADYRIDFVIHHNDKTKEFVEVKGYPTDVWRLKWKLFEAQMDKLVRRGEVKLTVVK